MKKTPIILIPANVIDYAGLPAHVVRDTYIRAIVEVMGGVPLMIPAMGKDFDFRSIADRVDGVLLSGSPSHVAPACYGEEQLFGDEDLDPRRDATTLPMIQQVIDMDKPLMAICRGFQELNVVRGGTLHQFIHEIPGKRDHRKPADKPLKDTYEAQAHPVIAQKGGLFEKIGLQGEFSVNTLHQQGINKLGDGLKVEAISDDGIIEAISIPGKRFVLGTQWHPEGDYYLNKTSVKIFEAFKNAIAA